jgi:two-component system LytT family response regulator
MRILIADDERIARSHLRSLLSHEPGVEEIRECANGNEVVRVLSANRPDVVFLDIQMPGLDGLTIAKSLARENAPLVVFVTAYEEYAIDAFAVRAFDYLLKPFDRKRLARTLEFVRQKLSVGADAAPGPLRVPSLAVVQRPEQMDRLAVRNRGTVYFIDLPAIDWIEAADNYVCVHTGQATHILRETLSALEARLDPNHFRRIHRSAIVNLSRVKEIRPLFRGDARLVLESGVILTVSRTFRDNLAKIR